MATPFPIRGNALNPRTQLFEEDGRPPVYDASELRKVHRSEYTTLRAMKELNMTNILPKFLLDPLLVDKLHHSFTSFHSLTRIGIADMRADVPAKGSYLLLRTLEPAILHTALNTVVEDHLGFVFHFMGYNFLEYNPSASGEEFLPVGTVFVLKEPLLTTLNCGCVIRSDSPSDFIRVDRNHALHEEVLSIPWTQSVDKDQDHDPTTGIDWKLRGNQLFRDKKFLDSLEAYLVALTISKCPDLTLTLHLNLAAVYLTMGNFESTLYHCSMVLETQPENEKALYRAGKALYHLRRFKEARERFQTVLSRNPQQKEVREELNHCEERIKEQEGNFNIYKLRLASIIKPRAHIDCSDYVGPLKVVQVPDKGRGVVATEDISPGTLLVVSKAISAKFYDKAKKGAAHQLHSVNLIAEVGRIIQKNPETFGKIVYELFTNDSDLETSFSVYCDKENLSEPIADMNRIRKIVSTNSFYLQHSKTLENFGTGLFAFPSYFNHSCVKNAGWTTYNDIMVIRALKGIKRGEEVTLTYGKSVSNYPVKTEKYRGMGFRCSCSLCELDHNEPLQVHLEREELDVESKFKMGPLFSAQMWKELILKMERSYGLRQELRLRLFVPYAQVFNLECMEGKPIDSSYTQTLDKAYFCLGLTCSDLFRCANDPKESLPRNSLLWEDFLEQTTCMVVLRLDSQGLEEEVLKWLKVMVMLERIFTGGGVYVLIDLYNDRDELEVCALLKNAKIKGHI